MDIKAESTEKLMPSQVLTPPLGLSSIFIQQICRLDSDNLEGFHPEMESIILIHIGVMTDTNY